MRHERITRRSQAALLGGWVSTTEGFLVGLILTLVATVFIAGQSRQSVTSNRRTQGEVNSLERQVVHYRGRLATVEAERNRLAGAEKHEFEELTATLTTVQVKHQESLAAVSQAVERQQRLESENSRLQTSATNWRSAYLDLQNASNGEKQDTAIRLVSAIEERDRAQWELESLREHIDAEPGLHKELIGLQGSLQRVVIVFDTSGSMSRDGRWDHARGVVEIWLEHLAIGQCALVLFNTDVHMFPTDGSFVDVRGVNGSVNRQRLLDEIRSTKFEGGTNTLLALQTAYQCQNVDTIILFTDGEPNDGRSAEFSPEIAEDIFALRRRHEHIPVNTIGLGDYFKPDLSGFLLRIAKETGGSFLGR